MLSSLPISNASSMRMQSLVAQEHGRAKYLHSSSNLLGKFDVVIPPLGESISDGVIAAVLKRPGDAVAPDEPIAQIETDKVTIDIPAPASGVLAEILINKDDTVVGNPPDST